MVSGKIKFKTGRKRKLRPVAAAAFVLAAAALMVTACSMVPKEPKTGMDEEKITLSMAVGEEGQKIFSAGIAVASAINNSGCGIHISAETSKGSPVSARNVDEGTVDLAMISGQAAYDARTGTGIFAGEEKKNICALGACYPEVSQWTALKESGFTFVHDLKGKTISAGAVASDTEEASDAVFSAMGIDGDNTEILSMGLAEGTDGLRNGKVEAAHGFSTAPLDAFDALMNEGNAVILGYTDNEIAKILEAGGEAYCKIEIPAGTYGNQETPIKTFGIKILFCASADMEEETAYRLAKALDEKGAGFTAGHKFMAFMQNREFVCRDLPVPLHPGAERYYREMGYLKE